MTQCGDEKALLKQFFESNIDMILKAIEAIKEDADYADIVDDLEAFSAALSLKAKDKNVYSIGEEIIKDKKELMHKVFSKIIEKNDFTTYDELKDYLRSNGFTTVDYKKPFTKKKDISDVSVTLDNEEWLLSNQWGTESSWNELIDLANNTMILGEKINITPENSIEQEDENEIEVSNSCYSQRNEFFVFKVGFNKEQLLNLDHEIFKYFDEIKCMVRLKKAIDNVNMPYVKEGQEGILVVCDEAKMSEMFTYYGGYFGLHAYNMKDIIEYSLPQELQIKQFNEIFKVLES